MTFQTEERKTTDFDGVVHATQAAEYQWEDGTYAVAFSDFEGRETQFGDAVLFQFHDVDDIDHKITGMASHKTSLRGKFMRWVGVLTGRSNAQLMAAPVNLRDHIGVKALAVVQNKMGSDGTDFCFVADIMPLPRGVTTKTASADQPEGAVDARDAQPDEDEDEDVAF